MTDLLAILSRYTRDFISFTRWQTAGLLLISTLNGVTQGIGFFMLIPLFRLFEIGRTEPSCISNIRIFNILHFFGISFNLLTVLSFFCILMTIAVILKYQQIVMSNRIERTYINRLQYNLFSSLIHADWEFISNRRLANITHIITNDLPIVANGTFFFLQMLSNTCLAACYIFWAANISLSMTLISLITAGVLSLVFRSYFLRSMQSGNAMRIARSDMLSVLMDHINAARVTKGFGTESKELAKLKERIEGTSRTSIQVIQLEAGLDLRMKIIANLLLCIMLYIALKIFQLPLVDTTIIILIFSKLVPMVSNLQGSGQRLISMLPSFSAAETLHSKAIERKEKLNEAPSPIPPLARELKIKDLSFSYKIEKEGFSIHDLNLRIPALKTTAIKGPSGSGKSTFVDLISGILEPDSGCIFSDDTPIDRDNLLTWRQSVGYVPQECILFNDTIKNNILMGKPDATDKEIDAALKAASADLFVNALPLGKETRVKDRGSRLSGGERQRIALARILIRSPRLLILDEATSSLDEKNEKAIFDSLTKLRGKLTILFISHSPETLVYADHVIDFPLADR